MRRSRLYDVRYQRKCIIFDVSRGGFHQPFCGIASILLNPSLADATDATGHDMISCPVDYPLSKAGTRQD